MKTTIDISDPLLAKAKRRATREGTTVKALVEAGLRQVLATDAERAPFKLRDGSYGGRGLRPELANAGWDQVRDLAYEGRGS